MVGMVKTAAFESMAAPFEPTPNSVFAPAELAPGRSPTLRVASNIVVTAGSTPSVSDIGRTPEPMEVDA
jgi:hypothetical protein